MKGHSSSSPLQKYLFCFLCFHLVFFFVELSRIYISNQLTEKDNTTKGSDIVPREIHAMELCIGTISTFLGYLMLKPSL